MKANNPIFKGMVDSEIQTGQRATLSGIIGKTSLLLLITAFIAGLVMIGAFNPYPFLFIGSIVGMIAVVMGRLKPQYAMASSIVYAACEGMFVGALSLIAEIYVPGVVMISVVATISIFAVMLGLYKMKIVQATPMLTKVLMGAGLAIVLCMGCSLVLQLFGVFSGIDLFSPLYLLLSAVLVIYGSFMLVLNFDEANYYVNSGLDKAYEWVASLGLIVTILYIYVQILRLLVSLLGNRD